MDPPKGATLAILLPVTDHNHHGNQVEGAWDDHRTVTSRSPHFRLKISTLTSFVHEKLKTDAATVSQRFCFETYHIREHSFYLRAGIKSYPKLDVCFRLKISTNHRFAVETKIDPYRKKTKKKLSRGLQKQAS